MSVHTKSAIGIDIGSRMTKIVRICGGTVTDAEMFDTGHNPLVELSAVMRGLNGDIVVATGYGRKLVQAPFSCGAVTEIKACARGARHLCPDCDSVIDIGGQDTKAIELGKNGGFGRFEMNDRCAAGTGRFLEVMASALGYTIENFGEEALSADMPVHVNSMCTVFAESEVVSLIMRGEDRRRIALGLHMATVRRVAAMASRITVGGRILFAGGVANNPGIGALLRDELSCELVVPERPEFVVALGAALIGLQGV
ncbi:acyl-CoA dehydratase activase [bacterium]|nr:acyl-CoA dehydratase activase [bacterium]